MTDVRTEILTMLLALQRAKEHDPLTFYYSDEIVVALGGNPEDYPELEGYPGVRVVPAK